MLRDDATCAEEITARRGRDARGGGGGVDRGEGNFRARQPRCSNALFDDAGASVARLAPRWFELVADFAHITSAMERATRCRRGVDVQANATNARAARRPLRPREPLCDRRRRLASRARGVHRGGGGGMGGPVGHSAERRRRRLFARARGDVSFVELRGSERFRFRAVVFRRRRRAFVSRLRRRGFLLRRATWASLRRCAQGRTGGAAARARDAPRPRGVGSRERLRRGSSAAGPSAPPSRRRFPGQALGGGAGRGRRHRC